MDVGCRRLKDIFGMLEGAKALAGNHGPVILKWAKKGRLRGYDTGLPHSSSQGETTPRGRGSYGTRTQRQQTSGPCRLYARMRSLGWRIAGAVIRRITCPGGEIGSTHQV